MPGKNRFKIGNTDPKDFDKEFHRDHPELNRMFKRLGWNWRLKVYK